MSPPRIQSRPTFAPQRVESPRSEPSNSPSTQGGPATRRAQEDTFEHAPRKGPVALDGGATGTAGLSEAPRTEALAPVDGVDPKVLETQDKLSKARQRLGELRTQDRPNPSAISSAEQEVKDLEALEKSQFDDPELKDDVEKAQFVVTEKRLGELEQKYGKEQAITMARQTYYNSDLWNLAGGSRTATDNQVLALGLPHVPGEAKNNEPAVGGYPGAMRTPDGQPVDMGHVLCGMDWQVNKDRVPDTLAVDDLAKAVGQEKLGDILKKLPGGGTRIPNPFDKGFVTLTGDLGSAVKKRYEGQPADVAIASESNYDWNGDLDGLNLAKRLETNPNQSLGDAMKGYYDSGESRNRVDEYATHGEYVKRDDNGQPKKDKNGHYQLDTDAIARDGLLTGVLLSKGSIADDVLKDLVNPLSSKPKEVAEAFEKWLHKAQDAS
ncbi:hypothetical protein JY651_47750 [Pyxidicoccus parkwayensis]|uniref:Uncharacterized protein n=1 Tax=Pyxidicoccus parkwayensis TaxID=2813578 RepID=A0ABX7NWB8_9BACT|nr:hypothetical protein [Pyxidicoccus parkwaysis]QSQ22716.1 hypothetical protein JY651_47750 [Pyxidicoccus parkwaysis]